MNENFSNQKLGRVLSDVTITFCNRKYHIHSDFVNVIIILRKSCKFSPEITINLQDRSYVYNDYLGLKE